MARLSSLSTGVAHYRRENMKRIPGRLPPHHVTVLVPGQVTLGPLPTADEPGNGAKRASWRRWWVRWFIGIASLLFLGWGLIDYLPLPACLRHHQDGITSLSFS